MTRSIREGDRSVFTLSTSSFLLVSPHSKRCTETNSEAPLSRTLCLKRCKTTSKSVTTNRTSPFLSLIFSTTLSTRSSVPAPVPAPSSTTRVVLPAAAEAAEAPKNCSIFSSRFKYAARSNEASHMVNPVSGTGSRSSFLRVFSSSSSSLSPPSSEEKFFRLKGAAKAFFASFCVSSFPLLEEIKGIFLLNSDSVFCCCFI
mmetsp:Transcript_9167/g.29564  ORF Transcript_9167/g.29564 Transcript_9167/m.29564 type:complete len:201 (+) Transcript_9167:282-884(+)